MKPTLLFLFGLASLVVYAQAPANDNLNNSIHIDVGTNCSSRTAGTLVGATDSGEGDPTGCGEGYTSDVWYLVEVPDSRNLVIQTLNASGSSLDSVLHVYTGTPGNLTQVDCNDNRIGNLSRVEVLDRMPGEFLYVRVWGKNGDSAPFEICVWSINPPVNNKPSGAIELNVGGETCAQRSPGDLRDATDSGVATPTNCGYGYFSDVWYSVEVPNSGNLEIETFNTPGSILDTVLHVYSGSSDSLTQIDCSDDGGSTESDLSRVVITGRTANEVLFVRVWGYTGFRGTFEICAWSSVTPPINNDFDDAIELNVGDGMCTHRESGDLTNATDSEEETPTGCGREYGFDVWYSAVVPSTGEITIETFDTGGNFFDSVLHVYTGSSGNLTQVDCSDDGGVGALSRVALSGQTPNEALYIRVWGANGDRDPFEICAWSPTALSTNTPERFDGFAYYPNPANKELWLEHNEPISEVVLYHITGKELRRHQPASTQTTLDVSGLSGGLYFMQVQVADQTRIYQIIKK